MPRLPVKKTYKLFVGGVFPRSESGRTYEAQGQNVARASRKDLRDAVVAARGAQPKWAAATAYNRGQVLYRIAEMMEARLDEFAALAENRDEVERAIDRWVWYAGFADKLAPQLASHLDVDAIDLDAPSAELERSAAENVKRVVHARDGQSPWEISSFLELKTVWHPIGT